MWGRFWLSPSHRVFGRPWYSSMADSENHRSALNLSDDRHFSGEQWGPHLQHAPLLEGGKWMSPFFQESQKVHVSLNRSGKSTVFSLEPGRHLYYPLSTYSDLQCSVGNDVQK